MTVAVRPDPDTVTGPFDPYRQATDWCVAIAVEPSLPNGTATQVATIDTCHGGPHIDRYYTAVGGPTTANSEPLPGWSLQDAERWVQHHWRALLKRFVQHHGPP